MRDDHELKNNTASLIKTCYLLLIAISKITVFSVQLFSKIQAAHSTSAADLGGGGQQAPS